MESEAEVDSKHVESKEDMFVDAADDIEDNQSQEEMDNGDTQADDSEENQLQQQINHIDTQADDKQGNQFQEEMVNGDTQADSNLGVEDNLSNGNKEEKEDLVEEVSDLLKQLRDLTKEQSLPGNYNGDSKEKPISASLGEMIKECSQRVKTSAEERLQTENMIRELRDLTNKQSFPRDDNEDPKEKSGVASLSETINDCSEWVKGVLEERLQAENTIRDLQSKIEDLTGKVQLEQNVEVFADRILGSLSTVVNQEELLDYSVLGKIAHVERSTSLLMEQYRWFLFETDQLRQCLTEGGFNVGEPEDFGYDKAFVVARGELLELKKTESEMSDKICHLEDVNRNLVEEIEKVKLELEQEKNRLANTKEKLSMAVTKGKALVQERVSLKQLLAEKTSELEKYMVELQEKSNAAENFREELGKSENLVVTLQEKLTEINGVLENCKIVMSKITFPEEFTSMDVSQRLQWLVDVFALLKESQLQNDAIFEHFDAMSSQLSVADEMESTDRIERLSWLVSSVASLQEKLSQKKQIVDRLEEILSNISLPEELELMDTVEKFRWFVEERDALKSNLLEFHRLKDALSLIDLPETVSSTDLGARISWLKESVDQAKHEIDTLQNEMEQLKASHLAELQEKEYIKMQLDDLAQKYETVSNQANQASLEKDQMVQLLLEAAGIQDTETGSDVATVVEKCLGKIKEQSISSFDTFHVYPEEFERMQSLLYLRVQDLMLREKLLEEDELVRSELTNLSNELAALKAEKDALQKDLERSEERSLLLKDKLSLAVKKGKGLVQDRENMKNTLDEKNQEIEKLKLELQQQESTISELRDQINRLSVDVEQVPKLEADLADVKNQRDQFEQFLLESNDILKKVIEAVDRIVVPVDSSFQEPVEKVNWIAGYVNECQQAKNHAEEELERVGEETRFLSSKLVEAEERISSMENAFSDAWDQVSQLEDALSVARNQVSLLTEEKRATEIVKENLEVDLQKLNEEAQTQTSKFMEEVAIQTGKLTEAYKTIKSLEDALSNAEANVALLSEQNNRFEQSRASLESEINKLKEEAQVQASRFEDVSITVKDLEDSLSKARNDITVLEGEKRNAELEISALNSKLKPCMDELGGTTGSLENRSSELIGYISDLQMLLKNENPLSIFRQHFEKEFESLRNMDHILNEVKDCFADTDFKALEDPSDLTGSFPGDLGDAVNVEIEDDDANTANSDSISLGFKKIIEGFHLRDRALSDNFSVFSSSIDKVIESVLGKLRATKEEITVIFEQMESAKQKIKNMEMQKEEQEKTISTLERSCGAYENTMEEKSVVQMRVTELEKHEIEQLKASLLAELQEKEYIKMQLDDLAHKYETVSNQAHQASSDKDQMVQLLLEGAGIQDTETGSDVATVVEKCFVKIKEQSGASFENFHSYPEEFERMQSLLYLRVQDLMLCEKLLEDDEMARSELTDLSNEFAALKVEKDSLQMDLERSEERSLLLKEKLSLAVKKGKGLVQDRENMKHNLEEKNSEIEKLKLELQQHESAISRLSVDVEQVPKLEADLADVKNQRDQFEQLLFESNNTLQKVIEAVDCIVVPVDSSFQEPVEKVNWIAGYVNECQQAKNHAEKELERAGEETSLLSSKLAEAEESISSMENTFSEARDQISQLEDALSVAQNQVSLLTEEKRTTEIAKENLEVDLQKAKEEVAMQTGKLVEAYKTMKSLEDALSNAEANVSLLSEQNNHFERSRATLESETNKLKEEAQLQALRFEDVSIAVKDLEDLLLKARNDISVLEGEKRNAELEISALNSKLKACMDELDGTTGSLENRSSELISYISDLQMLLKNESLLSSFRQHFKKEFESLRNIDHALNEIKHCFVDTDFKALEDLSDLTGSFPFDLGDAINVEKEDDDVDTANTDSISLGFKKIIEGFHLRDRTLFDKFSVFSSFIDKLTESVLGKLRATKDEITVVFEQIESVKQKIKSMEMQKEEQEKTSNVAASIIEELQKKLGESKEAYDNAMEEKSAVQMRVTELEKNLVEMQNSFEELQQRLKEKDAELLSLHHNLSMREREAEEALMSGPEINSLFNKISEIEFAYGDSFGVVDSRSSNHVEKLFSIIDNIPKLLLQINALSNDKEKLESTLSLQTLEIENLREHIEKHVRNEKESEIQDETSELTLGIERLIEILGDVEVVENQKSAGFQRLLTLVEKKISALLLETKNSKSQAEELGKRLLESQKVIEDLSAKVNLLEDSSRNKTVEPEIVQERSIFEAPSLPTGSEISEIEDVGPVGKNATLPVSSAAQLRGMKKGSTDHLVLNVDSESSSLINNEETAEDKGHVFKSLNTSGLIPKQGKLVADRIDGIWVSGGRVLTSRPKARLGFIVYWMMLHIWLLATIL